MSFWLWGVLLAFFGGALIGIVNFLLSRFALRKRNGAFFAFYVVRQILQIAYLVGLYLIAPLTPWRAIHLLIGGALGLTVVLLVSTIDLMKQNRKGSATEGEEARNG